MESWYMSGAGNDFVVIDARGLTLDLEKMAVAQCKRTGADGFMAVDTSEIADFRLHFYNSDGSRGEMCGNGSRCVCKFAFDHGIAGESMTVQTDAGIVEGHRIDENTYRVRLNDPSVVDLARKPGIAYVELGNPGVPHAVVELPSLAWDDREALRAQAVSLRHDPAFPKGANVNFYCEETPGHGKILTYERGVEDYTLACGTGSGSTAAALFLQGRLPGGRLIADVPGGTLTVDITGAGGEIQAVHLQGPAQCLAIAEIE